MGARFTRPGSSLGGSLLEIQGATGGTWAWTTLVAGRCQPLANFKDRSLYVEFT